MLSLPLFQPIFFYNEEDGLHPEGKQSKRTDTTGAVGLVPKKKYENNILKLEENPFKRKKKRVVIIISMARDSPASVLKSIVNRCKWLNL